MRARATGQKPPKRDPEHGFTLLEVLVAFALLSIVLGAAYASLGAGVRSVDRTSSALRALSVAENVLDEIGSSIPLTLGTQTIARDGWRVDIHIQRGRAIATNTLVTTAVVPFEIEVRIAQAGTPDDHLVTLKTLRLGSAL